MRSMTMAFLRSTFLRTLAEHTRWGTLELSLPGGERHRFGGGEPRVVWKIHDPAVLGRVLRDPELEMGETYSEGGWDPGDGQLVLLLELLMRNLRELRQAHGLPRVFRALSQLLPRSNGIERSRKNVTLHYELDEWLFRRFLDEDLQYSCAYFPRPGVTLEQAQRAKLSLVRTKLCLRPGDRVLDIGCGWGGLALYLAERDAVQVTGLTLSRHQLEVARRRAKERGLESRVRFFLEDYREHRGVYDRVVSVGMFEHVGQPSYERFFDETRAFLEPDGLSLLHTIGRSSSPTEMSEWVRRRIFPGSHLPSLSEIVQALERSRLVVTDVEVLRLHYAKTLACWLERFLAHRGEIRERLGERFCRTWEFYLACSQASFRVGDLVVFQVQLGKDPLAAPLTRDYLLRERDLPRRHDWRRPVAAIPSRRASR